MTKNTYGISKREIEFRVWNESCRDEKPIGGMSFIKITNKHCGCGWIQNPETVFMQFTNILDKNGEKIFEGDIIKYSLLGVEHIHLVEYKQSLDSMGFVSCGFDLPEKCEVIGNVFQNPELLDS